MLATLQVEIGKSPFEASTGKKKKKRNWQILSQQTSQVWWFMLVISATQEWR
jgi:hypothetical protein